MYYDRNEYDVTYISNTDDTVSDMPSTDSVHYGLKTDSPDDPSRTGYTLSGWYKDSTCDNEFNFDEDTITDDLNLYAKWTANTDTEYTVKHYKENTSSDGYDLADTDNLTGTTDTSVTGTDKEYSGFTLKEAVSGTISADGTLVLNMYYDRNEDEATYVTNKVTEDVLTKVELSIDANGGTGKYSKEYDEGESVKLPEGSEFTNEGYVLAGYSENSNSENAEYLQYGMYEMPAVDKTLYAIWHMDTDNDGISDIEEKAVGTDYTDQNDSPYKGNISIKLIGQDGNPLTGITCILNSSPIVAEVNSNGVANFNDVNLSNHNLTLRSDDTVLASYYLDFINGDVSEVIEVLKDGLTTEVSDLSNNSTLEIVIKRIDEDTFDITEVNMVNVELDSESDSNETKTTGFNWLWLVLIAVVIGISGYVVIKKIK